MTERVPPESNLAQALDVLRSGEGALIEALARLVAIDTSFPPGNGYAAFAEAIEAEVAALGFRHRRVVVPQVLWDPGTGEAAGERINVLADRRTGAPVCSLYFHVDTVPAGPGWTRPPLHLSRDGDRLYGRGTADMKGTIAAALAAIGAADHAGVPLAFDPVLLFCTDEEGGLYPGIRYLAEQERIEGHLLSFNGQAAPRVWAGCFGSVDLRVTIRGRSAHSGDPVHGINAVEAALPLLNALTALKTRVETRSSAMPPPPHYPDGRPLTAKLTIAAVHGGHKGSALPGDCTILVNRRYAPEERFEDVMAELRAVIAEAMATSDALGWEDKVVGHLAPVSDPTGPHWSRWIAAVSAGFGYRPEEWRAYGSSTSSDMGWVQQAGIGEILLGGLTRPSSNAHGPDEHTTVPDLMALARSILLYLAEPFRPGPLVPVEAHPMNRERKKPQ